jgi:hypothetical protein
MCDHEDLGEVLSRPIFAHRPKLKLWKVCLLDRKTKPGIFVRTDDLEVERPGTEQQ